MAHATYPVSRISSDELSYHRKVLKAIQQSQANLQTAQANLQTWMNHLGEKYELPSGSRVDLEGAILRPDAPVSS